MKIEAIEDEDEEEEEQENDKEKISLDIGEEDNTIEKKKKDDGVISKKNVETNIRQDMQTLKSLG